MQITTNNNTGISFDLGLLSTGIEFSFACMHQIEIYREHVTQIEYSIERTIVVERNPRIADAEICIVKGCPSYPLIAKQMRELQALCEDRKKPLAFISPLFGIKCSGFEIITVSQEPNRHRVWASGHQTVNEWISEFERIFQDTVDRLSKQVTPREYPRRRYRMAFSWP